MELELDKGSGIRIEAYEPGKIRINGQTYTHSLLLTPEKIIADWRPQSFADLNKDDFQPVLDLQPTIILLGVGTTFHFPAHTLLSDIHAARIGLETMTTDAACRTYNLLMSEDRNVVACLLI
jgi:uncharacterized protein